MRPEIVAMVRCCGHKRSGQTAMPVEPALPRRMAFSISTVRKMKSPTAKIASQFAGARGTV